MEPSSTPRTPVSDGNVSFSPSSVVASPTTASGSSNETRGMEYPARGGGDSGLPVYQTSEADMMPPQQLPPLMERDSHQFIGAQVPLRTTKSVRVIDDKPPPDTTQEGAGIWGGALGLGGGGNPLQYMKTSPGRPRWDTITSTHSGVLTRAGAAGTLFSKEVWCRACRGEEGGFSETFIRHVLLLSIALILGLAGAGMRGNDTAQELRSGDMLVYNIILYFSFICAAYTVAEWIEGAYFWLLHRVLTPCGKFTRTVTFYASSFDGTLSKAIWTAACWSLYDPLFDISVHNNWLDKLWATILTLTLVNGFRMLVQRWILSNLLRSTYEGKVDQVCERYFALSDVKLQERNYKCSC
eukprot:gb/GECG01001100.1/.p1 GENE.gb/GECG01001100.1/~~gb/GECG01001100.1/.p1  ORF type:complete len:354 (+),score=22.18 gb/GECG01001100.1/:1-1062(+)